MRLSGFALQVPALCCKFVCPVLCSKASPGGGASRRGLLTTNHLLLAIISLCVCVCVCVFLCVCLHDKGLSLPNLQSARVRCDCRGETRGFALEPNFVEEELCSPKALPESRLHPSCTRTCNIPDLQLLHRLEVLTARCGMRRSCQWRQSRRCMRRPEGQGSLLILRAAPAFLLSVVA